MNEIPTPVTMGILSQCHQKTHEVDFSDLAKMTECSQDLERRLAIARGTLSSINFSEILRPDIHLEISRVLKQTAP